MFHNRVTWLLTAISLWAVAGPLTVAVDYDTWLMTVVRATLAGGSLNVGLVVYSCLTRQQCSWRTAAAKTLTNVFCGGAQPGIHWLGAVTASIATMCFIWGFLLAEILNVSILNSGSLLLLTIWKRLKQKRLLRAGQEVPVRDRVSLEQTVYAYIGCGGLLVVGYAGFRTEHYIGTALGVCCAFCTTLTMGCTDILTSGERDTAGLECWALADVIAAAVGLVFVICLKITPHWPTGGNIFLLVMLGVFTTALPDVIYIMARTGPKAVPLVPATLMGRLGPIISASLGWYYLGQEPSGLAMFGAGIVLTAIVLSKLGLTRLMRAMPV